MWLFSLHLTIKTVSEWKMFTHTIKNVDLKVHMIWKNCHYHVVTDTLSKWTNFCHLFNCHNFHTVKLFLFLRPNQNWMWKLCIILSAAKIHTLTQYMYNCLVLWKHLKKTLKNSLFFHICHIIKLKNNKNSRSVCVWLWNGWTKNMIRSVKIFLDTFLFK